MQEFLKQSGFIILSLLILVIIRQSRSDIQIPIKLVITVVLFSVFMGVVNGILNELLSYFDADGIKEYASIMLKALFIGIISSICSSLCTDAGEGTLSYVCTLLGKAQILLLSLPLIKEIVESAIKLIDGADI